jgi:hypothetical protein
MLVAFPFHKDWLFLNLHRFIAEINLGDVEINIAQID